MFVISKMLKYHLLLSLIIASSAYADFRSCKLVPLMDKNVVSCNILIRDYVKEKVIRNGIPVQKVCDIYNRAMEDYVSSDNNGVIVSENGRYTIIINNKTEKREKISFEDFGSED